MEMLKDTVVEMVHDLQLGWIGVLSKRDIAVLMPLTRFLGTSVDISKAVTYFIQARLDFICLVVLLRSQ